MKNSPRQHTSAIRQQLESSADKLKDARLTKKMRIAFKIADGIDAINMKNKDLAAKLDKYESQITNWLKGDHNFTIDTLSDIEEILGIQLLDLGDSNYKLDLLNTGFEIKTHSISDEFYRTRHGKFYYEDNNFTVPNSTSNNSILNPLNSGSVINAEWKIKAEIK